MFLYHIDVSLSLSLSLSLPLSKINKHILEPWPVWLRWWRVILWTERSQVQFPVRTDTQAVGSISGQSAEEKATDQCFSLPSMSVCPSVSLPLPISLKAMKKCPWVRIKNK